MELVFPYRGFEIQVDDLERPYFAAAGAGRLIVQECGGCSLVRYPPSHRCAACGSAEWTWLETSGKGRVFSCLMVEHSVREDFPAPYAIGLVELDDLIEQAGGEHAVRILTTVLGTGDVTLSDIVPDGTPVEAVFRPLSEGFAFPEFRVTQRRMV
jgi:uncharacterized OB-fold protein